MSKEIRDLIFKMTAENPTWRAPRIHGELVMLGFAISERSVSRWMRRAPRTTDPSQRWLTFLRNHREAIAAMDFFIVPTVSFNVLYVFFIIGHDRRRILHFNVTLSVDLSKNDRILVGPVGVEPTSRLLLRQLRMPVPPRAWLTRLKLNGGSVTQSGLTEES